MFRIRHRLVLILLLYNFTAPAQIHKPILDTAMLRTWPSLSRDIKLTSDGRYVAYLVKNQPLGKNTLVLQGVKTNWKIERVISDNYFSIAPFYFSNDNHFLYWQNGDSLFLETTDKDQRKLLAIINEQCLAPATKKGSWIAWREKDHSENLVLYNLLSGRKQTYSQTDNAAFDESGSVLLLEQQNAKKDYLRWVNLVGKMSEKIVWEGDKEKKASDFHFDRETKQLCFLLDQQDGSSVFYYRPGMDEAIEKYNSINLPGGWKIVGLQGFNQTGKYILVNTVAQKEPHHEGNPDMVGVDVWDYRDKVIHPAQLSGSQAFSNTKTGLLSIVVSENQGKGIFLNSEGCKTYPVFDYCLFSSDTISAPISAREFWVVPKPKMWLQSLKGGKTVDLPFTDGYWRPSPNGRWLLFGDIERGKKTDYFSYELTTGKIHNLTAMLPVSIAEEKRQMLDSIPVGIAGWYGEEDLLVYDNYDIWKLDLAGKKTPVNLTDGYGLRNNIKLRIVPEKQDIQIVLKGTEKLLLTGYNEQTKYNGFLNLQLLPKGGKEPQLLCMEPFSWYKANSQVGVSAQARNEGIVPLAGGEGKEKLWVLMGESATEYCNYYYTHDFKKFTAITNFAPHKNYNWLTTEMVNWSLPDGQIGQGVLFKPEDFDSTKKYPVIFNYYERKSGWMYQFIEPRYSGDMLNIPWFVSHGYLVFTPDIPFSDGSKTGISSGEHAWMVMESAAKHLSKRAYIDSTRLGLQSYSFGGQLTLCIYSRSKRFAAAMEGGGFTDEMSTYLGLIGLGLNMEDKATPGQAERELHHDLLGATPWDKPELYLKNSTVWRADKLNGPLLIMHNKKDEQVNWQQGVEMYLALRRLQKPCWMLQYDGQGHGLNNKKAGKDYTIRMTQYFDHYLKQAPAPGWMTTGIPARYKQVENRYELDPSGNCSKDCKVCMLWNEKAVKDLTATMNEIREKAKIENWMMGVGFDK